MIAEFFDRDGRVEHDDFKRWCRENEGGVFLTFKAKAKAKLHVSGGCHHNGGGLWLYDGLVSITAARKVCSTEAGELMLWASQHAVEWEWCKHCAASLPSPIPPPASPQSDIPNAVASGRPDIVGATAKALEGIAREVNAVVMSRNSGLRDRVLRESGGTCEACGVNFSNLLRGRALRALQVHHRKQVALLDAPALNGPEDLAVVCANCHSIIHADLTRAMPVEHLRTLWDEARRE